MNNAIFFEQPPRGLEHAVGGQAHHVLDRLIQVRIDGAELVVGALGPTRLSSDGP